MTDRLTFALYAPEQAREAFRRAWERAKAATMDGHRMVLELRPETRSSQENRLLHALIGEIAAQKEWAGAKREPETWKRLLVAAWSRVHGQAIEVLPALDGHGVDIVPVRTSKLTKSECADLITFIQAWGVENGVEFSQ